MAILQTHMMIVRPYTTGIKTYKPDSNELETYIKIIKVDNKTANVQIEKMVMRYVLVDNERCLNGQNTA